MKLRIQAWFTDPCNVFLNNLFKWYPQYSKQTLSVLEWGGGNSSLYFLQRNCRLLTIESDEGYINDLLTISRDLGYKSTSATDLNDATAKFADHDLTIIKAARFDEVGESVFGVSDWSIIVNDGIARKDVIEAISRRQSDAIIVLDNAEYCANWGRLDRCAAHPDRVKSYRQILRDPSWRHYLFEQIEGRVGHSVPDSTGWEAPHRWVSAILWRHDHLLSQLMVSHLGLPLVTCDGLEDQDVDSLPERCPFDWGQMKWLVDEYSEVFTLERKFE